MPFSDTVTKPSSCSGIVADPSGSRVRHAIMCATESSPCHPSRPASSSCFPPVQAAHCTILPSRPSVPGKVASGVSISCRGKMTQLRSALCLSMVLTALTVLSACSSGSDEVPAAPQQGPTLSGHAVLPAASFITAPADAPPVLHTSGRDALSDLVRHSLSTGDPLPGRLQQAGAIRDPDGRVVFPG